MSYSVNDYCGFKVPFINKEHSASGFRASIEKFLDEPSLVEQFSQAAYKRAQELSWESIVNSISMDYTSVCK
jgi:hypothetical protein